MSDLEIAANEIERLKHPDPIEVGDEPIEQPGLDSTGPRMNYPDHIYAALMTMSDAHIWHRVSETTPPVPLPE